MLRFPLTLALLLFGVPQVTPVAIPASAMATPTACLAAVRAEIATQQKGALAAPPSMTGAQAIAASRITLARQCTARFDPTTVSDAELASLIDLYSVADQGERMTAAVDRALAATSLSPAGRAQVLLQAVQSGLAEPESGARNTRLEGFVTRLDALPDATAYDQKFTAHHRMAIYYRSGDVEPGIVRHSNWIIDTAKRSSGEQRKKYTSAIVAAYLNMALSMAGRGESDRALAMLKRIGTDFPDIPSAPKSVQPDIERLQLVGTPAAALTTPRWLNLPAGQKTVDLKGQVTLLEFSAHWCVPCKASYPALARLRQKYGSQGFRVVMATELYGFFERETDLTADAELARDRTYFAATGLNVPIAIADGVHSQDDDANRTNYKVGGIPQIQLIDRRGNIRLLMVGYDASREATLARLIEGLLTEK